jgi:hypothetical protein
MTARRVLLIAPVAAILAGCTMLGTMTTPVARPAPWSGWNPTPDAPDPAYLAAAERDCVPRFKDAMTPFVPEEVIQDHRGNRAMFIFQSRTAQAEGSCEVIEGVDGSLTWSGGWSAGTWSPGHELWLQSWGDTSNLGDVPPQAARVEIVTESGQVIEATVAHDRFVAWWPDADPSTSITAYDASGSVIATIPGGGSSEPDP